MTLDSLRVTGEGSLLKMGSYLSIYNNTEDDWYVKVGSDQAAAGVATWVGVGVIVVGATAGFGASVLTPLLATGGYFGIGPGVAGAIVTASATTAASWAVIGASFSTAIGDIISRSWKDDGFVLIKPGTKHRWGKMTLSLWQQAECRRHRKVSDSVSQMAKLYMRPIFSHSLANNDYVYYIRTWLEKLGVNFKEMEIRQS